MADVKITALLALTAADPINDVIPIVDVNDISMAASGTTKKISVNNLLSSSPTASGALTVTGLVTAGSATITGAATVGTTLGVTGVSTFAAGTALLPALTTTGDTNTGIYYPAADAVAVTTGGAEVIRVTATGLGIGVIPNTPLAITHSDTISTLYPMITAQYVTGTYAGMYAVRDGAGDQRGIAWQTRQAGFGVIAEKMRLSSDGNLSLANGNVVMTTSGKGIDFGATTPDGTGTVTSELLNDYEEGTWTIGLTFGGGNTGLTTSSNAGRYTKVGRQVTVTGYIELTNKGSSTGSASITGLPFTISAPNASYSAASLRLGSISYIGAFQGFGAVNTTLLGLEQISTLGAVSSLTDANFVNASSVIFTLTYTV